MVAAICWLSLPASLQAQEKAGKLAPITPPKLEGDKVVRNLPGPISDVVVGGGGRYLCIYMKLISKIAIFDVSTAQITGFISADDDKLLMAAGADNLVVLYGQKGILSRWNLATREREMLAPVDLPLGVSCMAMGATSQGPLMIVPAPNADRKVGLAGVTFFDLATLTPIKSIKLAHSETITANGDFRAQIYARASGDGEIFTIASYNVFVIRLEPNKPPKIHFQGIANFSMPSLDGSMLYSMYHEPYTSDLDRKPVVKHASGIAIPTIESNCYANFKFERIHPSLPKAIIKGTLHSDDNKLLGTLPDLDLQVGQRVHLLASQIFISPSARMMIVCPEIERAITLYRLDERCLGKGPILAPLVVTSQPPEVAQAGETLEYQMRIRSPAGASKLKLESGPEGMTLSEDGKLTWPVPEAPRRTTESVIVAVSDASGRSLFHSFRLTITGGAEPPPGPEVLGVASAESSLPTLKLPAPIADVQLGGSGRYLILHLKLTGMLAIVDTLKGKVVKYLPFEDRRILYAAGDESLVVYSPAMGTISRYSLSTFEKELTVAMVAGGAVRALALGAGSDGPLLVSTIRDDGLPRPQAEWLRVNDFKQLEFKAPRGNELRAVVRVSGDGRVFATWEDGGSPSLRLLIVERGEVRIVDEISNTSHAFPSPDGKVLFTDEGLQSLKLKPIGEVVKQRAAYLLPPAHGDFHLRIAMPPFGKPAKEQRIALQRTSDQRTLATLDQLPPVATDADSYPNQDLSIEKRLILIPDSKVIVVVPSSRDRLLMVPFDLEKTLKEAGVGYLYISSRPPRAAVAGKKLSYQIQAKSANEGFKYTLDLGPEGMTVSASGLLEWAVPAAADGSESVIVGIRDSDGQELLHTFDLPVVKK